MKKNKVFSLLEFKDGLLYWKSDLNKSGIRAGHRAGHTNKNGYRYIRIFGKRYLEHRLVWFLYYGVWPAGELDHINQVKHDNRIENLREVTRSQNCHNTPKHRDNTYGHKGVTLFKKTGKYSARIMIDGVARHLGYYDSPEEAGKAYEKAAKEVYS